MSRRERRAACAAALMRALEAFELFLRFASVRDTNAIDALGDPLEHKSWSLEEAFRVQ
jgi:hypothetical protein